jgi:Carboxypeptidase regulatory-like domain
MVRFRCLLAILALVFAGCISTASLEAQSLTTGQISGTITDSTGAVVPNLKVVLKSLDKGSQQETKTNSSGAYQFSLLPPGNYMVSVDATGFQAVTRQTEVPVGRIATVDISLTIGKATETVTVTEQIPLVNIDNGNLGASISEKQVSEVPNPGNDITFIAQVAPGVVANTTGGQGNFASNGISATANLFTLDGMDNNDPYLSLNNSGATNLTLGQNEVQEVAVVTNGYSGEYGGLAGANVNYVTRSGSNEFHGRALWYWNGSSLNANSFFNNLRGAAKPFVNDNQWGGDFGGPIVKNKLFGYFNTEGLRVLIPASAAVQIPTQAFEAATIANLTAKGLTKSIPFYQNIFNLYNNAPGASAAVPGLPQGGGTGCGQITGLPNTVTNCVANFQSSLSNLTHDALYTGRVDYNFTNNDRVFLRINYEHGFQAGFTDPINSLFNLVSDQPAWQGQLNETHTFGSAAVNQFILSGQWYQAQFSTPNLAKSLAAFPSTMIFGDGSLTTLGGLDRIVPQGRNITQYQISDDYSRAVRSHNLKFGVKFRRNDVTDFNYGQTTSGLLIPANLDAFFNGGTDAAINGITTNLNQAFPTALSQPFAFYTLGGYAQDEWRVKSNLSVTFALRVDHVSNPVCQTKCFAETVVPFGQLEHSASIPYNQAIKTGLSQALPSFTNLQWQPRVSFAWSPFGRSRSTVIRGGIGIFYDQFPGNVVDPFSSNLPLLNNFSVGGTSSSANIAPQENNNVFAAAAASNAALKTGFAGGQTLAQIQAAAPGFVPPTIAGPDSKNFAPQYQKWSLGIEQGFGQNTSISVQYVGNHGIHELTVDSAANAFCTPSADPTNPCGATGFTGIKTAPTDARFGPVVLFQSRGVSNYNGLQTSVQHRFSHGGTIQANYTWSHALDEISNGGLVQFSNTGFGSANSSFPSLIEPGNPRRNYGNADYDVRHYLSLSYVYELPFSSLLREHGPKALVNGWQVSGTVFTRSGLPFTIVDGGSAAASTLANQNFGSGLFPAFLAGNINGPVSDSCNKRTLTCLNPAQFSVANGGIGNAGRNSLFGPSYFDTDFAITKRTHIPRWERGELGIGFQFYNILNHPNFDAPVANVASGNFGKLVRTISSPTSIYGSGLGADASPRLIQLKLQLTF